MKFKNWLLKLLLNKYKKALKRDLKCARMEYDMVCLNDDQLQRALSIKKAYPKQIEAIETVITGVSQYNKYSRY